MNQALTTKYQLLVLINEFDNLLVTTFQNHAHWQVNIGMAFGNVSSIEALML
jgi:hypothetical protein